MTFNIRKSFKKEFKRQLRLAIAAASGFTIAFAWRDTLFNAFEKPLSLFFSSSTFATQISYLLTAFLLTILGVLVLLLSSKFLSEKRSKN